MEYDEIIDCPKSGGDLCYKLEVTKEITNYFSLSCGFWTNTLMTPKSDFYKEQIESLPELYKDLSWEDKDTGLIWLPTTINEEGLGMIFAKGKSTEDWKWGAVLSTPVKENEKEKFPIPGKKGEFYEKRMDMDTIKEFNERDFIEAMDYIGIFEKPQQ